MRFADRRYFRLGGFGDLERHQLALGEELIGLVDIDRAQPEPELARGGSGWGDDDDRLGGLVRCQIFGIGPFEREPTTGGSLACGHGQKDTAAQRRPIGDGKSRAAGSIRDGDAIRQHRDGERAVARLSLGWVH